MSTETVARVTVGPLEVATEAPDEVVTVYGKPVALSRQQVVIITRLARSVGSPVTADELCALAGVKPGEQFKNLHNEMFRLRARLGEDGARCIRNVRGVGYALTEVADAVAS